MKTAPADSESKQVFVHEFDPSDPAKTFLEWDTFDPMVSLILTNSKGEIATFDDRDGPKIACLPEGNIRRKTQGSNYESVQGAAQYAAGFDLPAVRILGGSVASTTAIRGVGPKLYVPMWGQAPENIGEDNGVKPKWMQQFNLVWRNVPDCLGVLDTQAVKQRHNGSQRRDITRFTIHAFLNA